MQTTPADVPSVKGAGSIEVSPYYQNLWEHAKDGYRAFMVYSGYEHLILSSGQVVYDAIMAGDSTGMIEKFVEVADATQRETVANHQDPAVLGSFAETFTHEQSIQFVANFIQSEGLGDFTLVSKGGINEQSAGNPSGISTWFCAGNVAEVQLNISLPRKTDGTISVLNLTGAQVKDLLQNGKTVTDEFDENLTSVWPYYWSGLDVTIKNDKVTSVKFNGTELEDDKIYRVACLNGDDPWTPLMGEDRPAPKNAPKIERTEVQYLDLLRQTLAEQSPIKAPEVLRK